MSPRLAVPALALVLVTAGLGACGAGAPKSDRTQPTLAGATSSAVSPKSSGSTRRGSTPKGGTMSTLETATLAVDASGASRR